jgi:hypothetical protein
MDDSTPPNAPLGVKLKRDRALEHFRELVQAISQFLESNPFAMQKAEANGQILYRFSKVETCPVEWGVLIGECLYNWRSALDHLIWQVASTQHDPPPDQLDFPIATKADWWTRWKARYGVALPPDGLIAIEQLQPVIRRPTAPDDDALAFLNRQRNIDAHRLIRTAGATIKGVLFQSGSVEAQVQILEPMRVVAVYTPDAAKGVEEVGFRLGIVFVPTPGDRQMRQVITSFNWIGKAVDDAIAALAPFC